VRFTLFDRVTGSLAALGAATALFFGGALAVGTHTTVHRSGPTESFYVVNHAPSFLSNATIRRDIPGWEAAMNKDFAPVWGTNQVDIDLVDHAPRNGIEVLIVPQGPIQGALVYHTVVNGEPEIVDYAGINDLYGYSNSVSITHEIEELLADPMTSAFNQGWPYQYVSAQMPDGSQQQIPMPKDSVWIQEVADPVEAYAFRVDGVSISDFVTPNWWNDEVAGGFDYMHIVGSPYTLAYGGYASFEIAGSWFQVFDFRGLKQGTTSATHAVYYMAKLPRA
jgi:hypothetical protein